ncbi:accessory Sec system glycosylation chaperone GtfB [Streptococcus panodentis]|uniref:UDP-N-acetylglucosamine--peptide N-acetylglucosaminyltransferase stabilizing protein GtfB n=1 Tax=Streptococcus panodentis TaxID=1581472 RepID=A0ABS5AY44_9STRE|nr:accessory Sec system glycosylation chaperone GtfB [Streptococcus panodentis]MBP2621168.1 accessory Sec system glycosylation chaperone GtfB [Streptococcus panodentis]
MIQLFDLYSQETQDLHDSLQAAGFDCPTIVLEANGFLPDDMISPYLHLLSEERPSGKARFFNQIDRPPFWEIIGDHQGARVLDMGQEKARIRYADQAMGRLVKEVDWLDSKGQRRLTDHYDKYGRRFAQTAYDAGQQALTTTYYADDRQERIVENHQTGDLILTLENEPLRILKNRVDFLRFFLERMGYDLDHILFNSLANSFLLSYSLAGQAGQDILFWQEPIGDALPGNMQLILEQDQLRTQTIVIPDRATYEKARSLAGPEQQHKLLHLGYHYDFKRDNYLRKDALILTHSDQIEQLETLVTALPQLVFRIAALTEMSPKLLSMLSYQNVVLYQNASLKQLEELYLQADLYLDINQGGQVLQAVRWAFDSNLLLLGFEQTVHDRRYIASQHIFDSSQPQQLVAAIEQALADVEGMRSALLAQGRHANDVPLSLYQETLQRVLGGQHD